MTVTQLIPIAISVSIFCMVFSLGLRATSGDATYLFRHPGLLARSILSMNVLMVVFAVVIASVLDLHPAVKIVILALAVSPVPPILPRKQQKMGGTESYAIGLLAAAVLLAIVLVPASIEIIGRYFAVDVHMPPSRTFPVVMISTILPLVAGILLRDLAPAVAERIAGPVLAFATVLLVVAVLPVLFSISGVVWSLVGQGVLIAMVLFTVVGLAIGHLLGGPDPDNRTVLALATCARHPGMALAIAASNFPEQKAQIVAVIVCHLIVGAVVAIPYNIWRKRSHAANASPAQP